MSDIKSLAHSKWNCKYHPLRNMTVSSRPLRTRRILDIDVILKSIKKTQAGQYGLRFLWLRTDFDKCICM